MIRDIRTAEAMRELIDAGEGYVYNDFGGGDPKLCPIHSITCRWVVTMLKPASGRLTYTKIWADTIEELTAEVSRRGKVYAFCGNEPGLGRAASAQPKLASPTRPARTSFAPAPDDDPDSDLKFHVEQSERVITVSSVYRLQFDEKPRTKRLKQAIGDAVARLRPAPGELLEAVYTSAATDVVDAENVLLYNVGTGRFAACAQEGLRFERVHAPAPGAPQEPHHHRYSLADSHVASSNWRLTDPIVRVGDVQIPRMDAMSKPDGVWFAVSLAAPADAHPHTGHYALELTLELGPGERTRPADIVKPLVDGLVAGLHSHDGRDLKLLASRLAVRMGVPEAHVVERLMDPSRAWLGTRRLLWPRADGLQWNPGDDGCVSATLRLRHGGPAGWRLSFGVFRVQALG